MQGTANLQAVNFDASQRLRVSEPYTLLQIDLSYDLDPMNLETGFSGVGNAVTYNSNQRLADLSIVSGVGEAFAQTYKYTPYQQGKSHLVYITFIFGAAATGVTKRVGYYETRNGIFLQQTSTGLSIVRRSDVSGAVVDDAITQINWNSDTLDGLGPSGYTFDVLAAQILFIDLQYLGHGIVRVGLIIDGCSIIAHTFYNSNNLLVPYMGTATLPVQANIIGSVGSAASTLKFKSCTVQTEGEKFGPPTAFMSVDGENNAGFNENVLSIRPKLLFNGRINRSVMVIDYIELTNRGVDVNTEIPYIVSVGQNPSVTGWLDVNTTFSAFEYNQNNNTFPCSSSTGITIARGTIPPATTIHLKPDYFYPISLSKTGAHRNFGMITIFSDNATRLRCSVTWKEYR
jgi:hypothetical protein